MDMLPNVSTPSSTQWTRECLLIHNTSADYSGAWMRRITCAPKLSCNCDSTPAAPPRNRPFPPTMDGVCVTCEGTCLLQPQQRSTAQPLNRSTAQLLNRSTAQPLNRSTARPLDRSTARPLDRSTARPLDRRRSTARPLDRSTARPINRSSTLAGAVKGRYRSDRRGVKRPVPPPCHDTSTSLLARTR